MAKKSRYQSELNRRFKAKRDAQRSTKISEPLSSHSPLSRDLPSADLDLTGDIHPSRYPGHEMKPNKGQVYGGECNRTACERTGATWWNIYTYGLYCRDCGPQMNFSDSAICAPVSEKPTLALMNDTTYKHSIQERALALIPHRG